MAPTISVVFFARNAEPTLGAALATLADQTVAPDEVIVVDNASQDATARIATDAGARVLHMPAGSFRHGTTRDWAVDHVTTDLLTLVSGDAVPTGRTFVEAMVAPFADPTVGAVQGIEDRGAKSYFWQRPRSAAFWFTRENRRWRRRFGIGLSNVVASYRTDVVRELRFGDGLALEDRAMQVKLAARGLRVVPASAARVVHDHDFTWTELRSQLLVRAHGNAALGERYSLVDLVIDEAYGAVLLGAYALPLAYRFATRRPRPRATEVVFPLLRPVLVYQGFRLSHDEVAAMLGARP